MLWLQSCLTVMCEKNHTELAGHKIANIWVNIYTVLDVFYMQFFLVTCSRIINKLGYCAKEHNSRVVCMLILSHALPCTLLTHVFPLPQFIDAVDGQKW